MPFPLLLALLAAPAPAEPPIRVTGHAWAPFISPMGEPFRPKSQTDDTLADWFYQADRNRDGILTLDEMVADADRFFAILDTDRDGKIIPDELIHYEWEVAPDIQVMSRMKRKPGDPVPIADKRQAEADDGSELGDRPDRDHWRGGDHRRRAPDDGGLQGAARYALINMPEPVAQADLDFDRAISRDEFRQAAIARFQLLDTTHQGRLTLAQLEAMLPTVKQAAKRPKQGDDAPDTRVGSSLPKEP